MITDQHNYCWDNVFSQASKLHLLSLKPKWADLQTYHTQHSFYKKRKEITRQNEGTVHETPLLAKETLAFMTNG